MKIWVPMAERTFRRRLSASDGSVRGGLRTMLDFYGGVRARGCSVDEEHDMLLFQVGRRASGPTFELDLTRQFAWSPIAAAGSLVGLEIQRPLVQLSLTYEVQTTEELEALPRIAEWCESPAALDAFRDLVESHAAVEAIDRDPPPAPEVCFEAV